VKIGTGGAWRLRQHSAAALARVSSLSVCAAEASGGARTWPRMLAVSPRQADDCARARRDRSLWPVWRVRRVRRQISAYHGQSCQHAALINPNPIYRDGRWCNLPILEGLAFIVTNEGTFLMKIHRPSRYVVLRAGGSARSARRVPSVQTIRAQATRGILAPAFMLVGLAAGAAVSPGHGLVGHDHASAGQPAHSRVLRASTDSVKPCKIGKMPWMYSPILQMPWMYSPIVRMPWMYSIIDTKPATHAPAACHASKLPLPDDFPAWIGVHGQGA
jgi:hypothetical protein